MGKMCEAGCSRSPQQTLEMQDVIQFFERNWNRRGDALETESRTSNYRNWENTGGERRTGATSKKLTC